MPISLFQRLLKWSPLTPTVARRDGATRAWHAPARHHPHRSDDLLAGPIHGELLGADGLAERARASARAQSLRPAGYTARESRLLTRLDETRRMLAAAQGRLTEASSRAADVGPAGEWLLDNAHVIEEHAREVRDSLPRGYYAELPELAAGALAGYPRVYEIATLLIGHTEGRIDRANVELFVGAFQEVSPLAIGELWAIPAMLRLALLESVRRMAARTLRRLDEVDEADRWALRLSERDDRRYGLVPDALDDFLAHHPPITPVFLARFLPQLRALDHPLTSHAWLAPWMAEEGVSAEDAATRAHEQLALTQVTTANSITSLRAIGRLDWKSFVERASALEAALRADPADVYASLSFATRDAYRHVVERIAKRTRLAEWEVASRAVRMARDARREWPDDAARGHVGYYLVDDGLPALESRTRYRPLLGERGRRWLRRHPNLVLLGGIGAGTLAALAAVAWLAGADARQAGFPGAWIAVLLLVLIPANEIGVNVLNQLITHFLPPRTLPKLDLDGPGGIPPEFRTVVVVPTLFGSVAAVREALENLEVQFLANREAHLHFAVLGDFTDAASETLDGDDAIVEAAVDGVRTLNERYADSGSDEFALFLRPRRWNERQGVWMGWERKRGKLAQFNRFLRGGATDAFSVVEGDVAALRDVRYAITLDADTILPPGAAPLLVGALAHPLNRAVYDAARGRVVRGFGILQPRVGVSLPSAHRSRFAAIHSGHPGVDPYTTAVSDVYQDLYGEGSFTGKGIYDVDAFEEATHGRFPENTLLSHDLIEGSYARAGLATDVEVFDDYPTSYLTHARRKHRWIRGDWQLLRWLGSTVPGPDGDEPNRLSLLSRWRLFDNLRRSLVEIAQFALVVAAWTVLPGSPLRWTALALLAVAAPWIVSLALAVVRPPLDRSWRAYYGAVGHDAVTSAQQVALAVTFLPHQAWISADAIARSLWRTLVSHRHLLEWQTASHVERVQVDSSRAAWRTMRPAVTIAVAAFLLALAMAIVRGRAGSSAAPLTLALAVLPLVALWIGAPAVAHALGAPPRIDAHTLRPHERALATRYARAHWHYFETFVSEESHWLAPDNFQDDPAPVVAMRTSPTNMGLQLLSTISAHDLGFIDGDAMATSLERAFRSFAKMRRCRGHFYNWYDLHDLRVLEPAYISTVDSGNLAGHLIAVRQACLSLAGESVDATLADRLRALAALAAEYAEAMDFAFLFDRDRALFSIGYQEGTHALDASSYDLLASEARLASFVAIARNQVPVEHWFRLGRTLTHAAGATALVSWSGSMFEYLMPALVMRAFPRTILDQTYHGMLRRQQAYARGLDVPWGISESAYNLRDHHLTYQYHAFGVPDLALKRGLGRDIVIAPYASALATMVDPAAALANLAALERLGAVGPYGFRDALDYSRPAAGGRFALVHTYMAHHVGMSLVALTNALTSSIWPERFHADPLVRAAELLLHERIPRRLVFQPPQAEDATRSRLASEPERPAIREYDTADTPQPRVALLGHIPYTVMITNGGGGSSRYEGLAVTRWRPDATTDDSGQFCYVKDIAAHRMWSVAHQPTCATADAYRVHFATDRATFYRMDGDVETRTEVAVVPADAAEVRRVTVTNGGDEVRELELTSYGEMVLASPEADRAHPAFANLFVETEWHSWCSAIIATRRPRSSSEAAVWGVHVVAVDGTLVGEVSYETDRSRFVGRGRSTRSPRALDAESDGALDGVTGAVLDPIVALRARVRLEPGASATVAFTTLVATTRERAFELADRYDDPTAAQRALDLASTTAQVELRELGIASADAALFQDLAGKLLFADPTLGASADERTRNGGSQPQLWAMGVSGDLPIVLASIASPDGLPSLRQLLSAHQYWRRRGVRVDLVVLDTHPPTYLRDAHDRIVAAILASSEAGLIDQSGGVFIRSVELLSSEALLMLRATARVHITCDGQSIGRALAAPATPATTATTATTATPDEMPLDAPVPSPPALRRSERSAPQVVRAIQRITARLLDHVPILGDGGDSLVAVPRPARALPRRAGSTDHLQFFNGLGGVNRSGDYEIRLHGTALPPAPWANVIANPCGGFVVTERGGGYAWAANSYFYRLTPWHNDPVSDPVSDVLYLRDEESGALWSATPAPIRDEAIYVVRHGAGASTFEHEHAGIATTLTLGLAPDAAVKLSLLRITNTGTRPRRLTVTAYVEWVLGVTREQSRTHVQTRFDAPRRAIVARNNFDPQFARHAAFCAISEPVVAHTAGRRGFLGRNGTTSAPEALAPHATLAGSTGVGLDPCAALQCAIELAPGASVELSVALGAGEGEEEVMRLIEHYRDARRARAAVEATVREWRHRLSALHVTTPDPAFDAMVNRWAPYQALACRMWARSALYQSSGAYGFRDQLQDVMALVYTEPALAREHIVRAAARQFTEGDVQHWWHPQSGRGVRTRFSDDMAWLPYVVDHYVRVTGDRGILDEQVPFLTSAPLAAEEHERYDLPQVSDERASVYAHCLRALRRACTSGVHGLPLIGIGDWNDGMSRVGIEGRGESVWLAWFLIDTLRRVAAYAEDRGDVTSAEWMQAQGDAYLAAAESHGWDGAWYRRAYFDDGTALGTSASSECRIDAIAQSWSVISGAALPTRQRQAMRSFEEQLVREDARILMLLTPPFDRTPNDPGYIKGYVPGVRENGAQYTHAALWSVLATAMLGDGDRAFALFQMLNPLTHARTPAEVATYKVEPYVVAADVYTAEGQLGRGGWTWYTGSASWLFRVAVESLLGFTKRGDTLTIAPCVPDSWSGYSVEYRHGEKTVYRIAIELVDSDVHAERAPTAMLDGRVLAGAVIPLVDDGATHHAVVRVGRAGAAPPQPIAPVR